MFHVKQETIMKNLAKYNRRALLRYRRPGWHYGPRLRKQLPTGLVYSVTPGTGNNTNWHYQTTYGHIFAPYPPDARTVEELHRWS
jgi:hypothetical protein